MNLDDLKKKKSFLENLRINKKYKLYYIWKTEYLSKLIK